MFKHQKIIQLKRLSKRTGLAILPIIALLLFSNFSIAQSKIIDVDAFEKIVVSPHIEVTFVEGSKESVSIESMTVPMEKLNVVVKNNTLNVYLDGAKITANKRKGKHNEYTKNTSIYNGTVVKAIITYKAISALDLRGEEKFVFKNNISRDHLRLNIYGESQVYMNEVDLNKLQVSLYGESYLEITKGAIENQKLTAYGESTVNIANVENTETKLTAYGDGSFQLNVSKKLKISSYGEATITYSGNPEIDKGIIIGETKITRVN